MAEDKAAEASGQVNSSQPRWLYNSDTGELLGRTGSSWFKILVFYVIFYACLAAFWGLMLLIFYQTLDPHYPKWQLDASRIGANPGLGFRPRPPVAKVDSTLIWFRSGTNGDWKHWVDDLDKYLKPYTQDTGAGIGRGESVATADECQAGRAPSKGKFCPFNYKDEFRGVDPCNANNKFGYELGKPCILLKVNKIYGWQPDPYTSFPSNMPPNNGTSEGVVITCEGENPADKENIGQIVYTPRQTIRGNHFPYTNQPGYLSPFVWVQFVNPSRGVLINVECKAWAKNIRHDRKDREGSVHFELMVD